MISANPTLVRAIDERRRLAFKYNGRKRVVEPQCYGIGKKGTELLRVHQIIGGTEQEPLFDVAKIVDLILLEEQFIKSGPNYKKDDSAMQSIFAQL